MHTNLEGASSTYGSGHHTCCGEYGQTGACFAVLPLPPLSGRAIALQFQNSELEHEDRLRETALYSAQVATDAVTGWCPRV